MTEVIRCPKCGSMAIRLKGLEEICRDKLPRYTCSGDLDFDCDVEYFNKDGVF